MHIMDYMESFLSRPESLVVRNQQYSIALSLLFSSWVLSTLSSLKDSVNYVVDYYFVFVIRVSRLKVS